MFGQNVWTFIYGVCISFCMNCHSPKSKWDLSSLILPSLPISEIYFSYPGRDIAREKKRLVRNVILSEIRNAKESIRMYLYSIDDLEIISELYLKHRLGVTIQIYGDKEEDYKELESFGFQVKRWNGSGIHHTKMILFDRTRLFLGTGNFTSHGLETDHNVYWIQTLTPSESDSLLSVLEGNIPLGIVTLGNLQYLFAPDAGLEIQMQLIEAIESAKHSIRYLIYSHYDPVISLKLLEASRRGVLVLGIYNAPMSTNPEGDFLSQSMAYPSQIWEDGNVDFVYKDDSFRGGLLHHKTMIVDEKDVYVGSYNYSVSARDQNKEMFVKLSHPYITKEFLSEWKRIQATAIPLPSFQENSNLSSIAFRQFSYYRFKNPLFESNLLFAKGRGIDSNSNGLAKAYESSLSIVSPLEEIFNQNAGERFVQITNESDPIWEESEISDLSLVFQNYFLGTKVTLSSGEKLLSITYWDGSHPKETITLDPSSIAIGEPDFRLGKSVWIWAHTETRTISFCHTKQKGVYPKWMVFLKNRFQSKRNQSLVCTSG
ncbi:phospholipase D-like domain-containing protein [Leptospira sp. WS60.C2]